MQETQRKSTIRMKLFLVFFLSIVTLTIAGLLLNILFLEKYYVYKSKTYFEDMRDNVFMEYSINRSEIETYLEDIGKRQEMNLEISDEKGVIEFSSIAKGQRGESLPKEVNQAFQQNKDQLSTKYVYMIVTNDKNEVDKKKLLYMERLSPSQYLVMSKPVSWITESVQITNQFSSITGAIIVLVGGLLTYFISSRATKPILEMSYVAKEISQLNFSTQVSVNRSDELGELGQSINTISEKLSESIDGLKLDIERRKQLVRDISHELKTPIGVIKGYSEGIQYGVADTPEMVEKYVLTIVDECNRMDNMVKELIELSRYEYVERDAEKKVVSVASLLETIQERFDPLFKEHNISAELNAEPSATIYADYALLMRAVSNFITNAIKHVDDKRILKIDVINSNLSTTISVYNSGSRIPDAEKNKVWDVFYKVDATRVKDQKSGSGIGLSIVKQIAVLHGGSVSIENEEEGVCFKILIPKKIS